MSFIVVNNSTCFLIAVSIVAIVLIILEQLRPRRAPKDPKATSNCYPDPPGPKPWPILGSLHILGQYDVPYKAFSKLVKVYGSSVVKLKMGSVTCVVVNGMENIKEVLVTKGHFFDSRPNFSRYHLLFSGNKENSLAFCNWSEVQKVRREMLRAHTFPRAFSTRYKELNTVITSNERILIDYLATHGDQGVHIKDMILHSCGNIFLDYFCSITFDYEHKGFRDMVSQFDKVFYEVNQGYAADFMPFLMPLHYKNMARMAEWSGKIRQFVEKCIIKDRFTSWQGVVPEVDYVDCLVNYVNGNNEPKITRDMALFALEDIIGGHSAVGNFLIKVLGYLVTKPHVQRAAQMEIDRLKLKGDIVGLEHRGSMPYVEAIILEAIRTISSPIVPHVANQDSSIAGYRIEKDTFIFLDNYELNMSEKLWDCPEEFNPGRFVKNGKLLKPDYFLPFGGGRRSCMGYKMVQLCSFATLASILKNFNIVPLENEDYRVAVGNLALPETTFKMRFQRR